MTQPLAKTFVNTFLGHAPKWYKLAILAFLLINPIIMATAGPFVAGWVLIAEFIFTLTMALKCYPLPAGGLLAMEAVIIGLTTPETIYHEAHHNFEVILLLIFMVAGIHFMKDFLQFTFTRILVNVRSKKLISLLFCFAGAFLSAFLDALTVTAVIMAVALGFYSVYHKYVSSGADKGSHSLDSDQHLKEKNREELKEFRGFLRNLMMHGAVGTALGGVCTLVGEPQNLLIGHEMGWHFIPFAINMAPVTVPVFIIGMLTCLLTEQFKICGYGYSLPGNIRSFLFEEAMRQEKKQGQAGKVKLIIQALIGIWLILALAFHLAAVGIVGLSIIVLLTAFTGVIEEGRIGPAFEEALPFTALLVVFFAVVAVIHSQELFKPIIAYVLSLQGQAQLMAYYAANGLLSAISDNVFVATVYISETKLHFIHLLDTIPGIGMSGQELMAKLTDPHAARADVIASLPQAAGAQVHAAMAQFDRLAVAINTGTNIPSVATPNGQAAFLFLLTSALAPVIRLSYGRMVLLALPYTITMSITGLLAVDWFL